MKLDEGMFGFFCFVLLITFFWNGCSIPVTVYDEPTSKAVVAEKE